jgi:hypothetical protein
MDLVGRYLALREPLHNLKVFYFTYSLESFRLYQIYSTIIRFDIETTIIFYLIRINLLNLSMETVFQEITSFIFLSLFYLTILLAPISLYFGVRKEIKIVQIGYLLFSLLLPMLIIFLLIVMWTADSILHPSIQEKQETKIIITFLCAFFMIVRLLLIVLGILLIFNFGLGLKEKIYTKDGIFHDYWKEKLSYPNLIKGRAESMSENVQYYIEEGSLVDPEQPITYKEEEEY